MPAVSCRTGSASADCLLAQDDEAQGLVAAMVEANGLELLVQRMVQFNEKLQDDATAVFNSLAIIENMVEVNPKVRLHPPLCYISYEALDYCVDGIWLGYLCDSVTQIISCITENPRRSTSCYQTCWLQWVLGPSFRWSVGPLGL